MSSKRVETREEVLKQLYDNKFGNLSQDIQEIIEEIIQKQEEEEVIKKLKKLKLDMSKYTNYSNDSNDSNKSFFIYKNIYNNTNGGRYNNLNYTEINIKDIKYMCKANQIKLSKVVNGTRIVYTKKELLTKLKRKKII